MDRYVSKPIRPETLFSELARLVSDSALPKAEQTAVPNVEASQSAGVLDRSGLLERVDGDLELLGDLIGLFKDDSVRQLAAIRDAIDKNQAEVVKLAAHTLKGTCGNLGAPEAAAVASELEKLAATGNLTRANDCLRALETQIQRVGTLLDEFRGELVR
jgi:two-component system sensor histidine kinase/response regulator